MGAPGHACFEPPSVERGTRHARNTHIYAQHHTQHIRTTDECRARVLARDAGSQEDYARFEGRTARTASGVPVSAMGDEYVAATAALADKVEAYLGSDPYDKARGPLIKAVKADAQAWVTKYARGGSVRKQSARRFYVAVDAVLGHLASNGLAPFPSSKAKVVRATLDEALQLLAEGK